MKLAVNRKKILVIVTAMIAFLAGYIAVSYLGKPVRGGTYVIFSQTLRWINPLQIEVSPQGYPVIGESWTIRVYAVIIVSGNATFQPSHNSTVLAFVNVGGFMQTYNLSVDTDGQTTFKYLSEYSDVAFQAYSGDLRSGKVIFSTHYVSSDIVDGLVSVEGSMTFLSVCGGILNLRSEKARRIFKMVSVVVICYFAVVISFLMYSRLFQSTVWGYPENVIDGIITLRLLTYAVYFGVVLLPIFAVLVFVFRERADAR
ncbi:MAG: hypothetical protein ABSB28_04765 [Candidatus Bathyarchaeia archaeon]